MKKIEYYTPYTEGNINGYVMAEEHDEYYSINRRQYNRAIKNLTIGGVAPQFVSDKPIRVEG